MIHIIVQIIVAGARVAQGLSSSPPLQRAPGFIECLDEHNWPLFKGGKPGGEGENRHCW